MLTFVCAWPGPATSILNDRIKGADWPEGPDNLTVLRNRGVAPLLNINFKHNKEIKFGTMKIGLFPALAIFEA